MSWRDQLRPGSFRGVAFKTREHTHEGGRRGEEHEFPLRDEPYFEDLGRRAKRWSFEALILGPDYFADRDAFLKALEAKGAGTLVHPYLGTFQVVCTDWSVTETTEEGGMASFQLQFAEPGVLLPADGEADTSEAATSAADDAQAAASTRFADSYSVAGVPAFVEEEGVELVDQLADSIGSAAQLLGGQGTSLRTFDVALAALPASAVALVRAPADLAAAVVGIFRALSQLGATPAQRFSATRRVLDESLTLPNVIGDTPARLQQRDNQDAWTRLVATVAIAEGVRIATDMTFASYDEAIAARDSFAEQIDAYSLGLGTFYADDDFETVEQLRRVMVRDITARGGSLARLYDYTPATTEPALVIAQRLGGDPDTLLADADELVARNRIAHPGFVTGGQPLEVRSNG